MALPSPETPLKQRVEDGRRMREREEEEDPLDFKDASAPGLRGGERHQSYHSTRHQHKVMLGFSCSFPHPLVGTKDEQSEGA
jgi:hypothetical protein